jgi:NADPH:quinone reductase-like Zn-dependent oxidoreductase
MKAIVYNGCKQAILVHNRPLPVIRSNYLLIRVVSIALNPTDWKHIERDHPRVGGLIGCDLAGVVEDIGSAVPSELFKKGDRVCGFAHGGNFNNPEDGAFAEYALSSANMAMKIPNHLSYDEAATLGVGLSTVAQGLFECGYGLGLALPSNPLKRSETLLIYGGSLATGTLGIQFAKA